MRSMAKAPSTKSRDSSPPTNSIATMLDEDGVLTPAGERRRERRE